jgi:hypothetical protein
MICVFPTVRGSRLFHAAHLLDVFLLPLFSRSCMFFRPRALMVQTGTNFALMEKGWTDTGPTVTASSGNADRIKMGGVGSE